MSKIIKMEIDDEITVNATKDNGFSVIGRIDKSVIKNLDEIVETWVSDDEKEYSREQSLLKEVFEDTSDEEKIEKKDLFPKFNPYSIFKFEKGTYYRHLDKLYKCIKSHDADNQLTPSLDKEHWEEVKNNKLKTEYDEHYNSAKPWSRDESYDVGVYVTWYKKLYKSAQRITDNGEPGVDDRWILITNEDRL